MAASLADLHRWWEQGVASHATHLIVVCDTFEYDDYPVYVLPGTDPREVYGKYHGQNMQRVMGVYRLDQDRDTQLARPHVAHF